MNGLSLSERRDAVYGTDFNDLMGLLPYGCRRKLWYSKRIAPDFPGEDLVIMAIGKALEPVIADQWQMKHPSMTLRESEAITKGIAGGHPDRIVYEGEKAVGILEMKTCGMWALREFKGHGLPERYIYQVAWYLFLTGLDTGFYAVMCRDDGKFIDFQIGRSDKLIAGMERDATAFMEQVKNDERGPDKLPLTDKRCRRCSWRTTCQGFGKQTEEVVEDGRKVEIVGLDADDELAQELAQYAQFKAIAAEAGDEIDRLRPEIIGAMTKRKIEAVSCPGVDGGYKLSRYKTDRIDTKQLRKEMPEVAVKYTKTSEVIGLKSISESEE